MFVAMLVISAGIGGTTYLCKTYMRAYYGPPPGMVVDQRRWPPELQGLIREASHVSEVLQTFRVYRHSDWGGKAEYVWESDAFPALLDKLIHQQGLQIAQPSDPASQLLLEKIPPGWESPDLLTRCEIYTTAGFQHGPSVFHDRMHYGPLFIAVHDRARNKLVVWYSARF
jgi:hypothetical protein